MSFIAEALRGGGVVVTDMMERRLLCNALFLTI